MPHRPRFRFRAHSLSGQILLIGLIVLALWLGGLHAFTRTLDQVPVGPLKPADAIVVLTGGSNRLQTGFDLLERGMGQKLFISGVYQGVEVRELLDLMAKGPDKEALEEKVVLGFEAYDTIGNAYETAAWLRKEGYQRFYLVTANYHIRRAKVEFSDVAPDLTLIALPVTPDGLDMTNWWRNDTHRNLIIREYMKFLLAHVRVWLNAFLKV